MATNQLFPAGYARNADGQPEEQRESGGVLPGYRSMIAFRVYRGIADHFVGRWPEWLISVLMLGLGVKLLGEPSVFDSAPGYRWMSELATEDQWGYAIAGVAVARLLSLTVNGTFRQFARWTPLVRSGMALLACFFWFVIAIGFYMSNPNSWGTLAYGTFLFMDMINAMLAGGDAGATERKYRNGSARPSP